MPVIESKFRYLKPAVYDELLTIKVTISQLPGAKIIFTYEITNEQEKLINTGETTQMKTEVAQRLRRLQAEEGITLQEMADRCGISKASLANYVRQKDPQKPGLDAVVAIAEGMNDVLADDLGYCTVLIQEVLELILIEGNQK